MNLVCACCGGEAPARHQWHNRDTGYGVCARCFLASVKKEGIEESIRLYGAPGIHHSIRPETPAACPACTAKAPAGSYWLRAKVAADSLSHLFDSPRPAESTWLAAVSQQLANLENAIAGKTPPPTT